MENEFHFDLKEELRKLPEKPGVYIMHDHTDAILYVGKAVNLRRRVHQYFVKKLNRGPKIEYMVTKIAYFEYIVTDSELEALILENNLIKEHRPKYNTLLKDDKTYPYIKVTVGETYPRVLFTRKLKKDGSRYFGPFKSAGAVRDTIELMRKLFQIRDCTRNLPRDQGKERPCLNYQIGQCKAPCQGYVSEEEYRKKVDEAVSFLGGSYKPVVRLLTERMEKASSELDFEQAAEWRDLRASVLQVSEKQKMESEDGNDRDVIAMAADGTEAVVSVFYVRGGRVIGRDHQFLHIGLDEDRKEILSDFVRQFYAGNMMLPSEVMLETEISDRALLEKWMSQRKGRAVHIRVPLRGAKEKLVAMARENSEIVLRQDRERIRQQEGRTIGAMQEIATLLGISHISRVEAYDISNTSGVESVGSMVVFEKGMPKPGDYRKFRIRTVQGPDDYASLKEVLTRRFTHGLEETAQLKEKGMDPKLGSFSVFPDLVMMDGGRGQVNIAENVLRELGLPIPVCGMVKDDYHRTRGLYFRNVELPIDTHSEGFKLITRIQDEAHRFAIEYHRSLRSKAQTHSVLDEIKGIGPARRKALLRAFGSAEAVRDAGLDQLAHAPSMDARSARSVWDFFHPAESAEKADADGSLFLSGQLPGQDGRDKIN
ncbi:excinuclease ABC subunit UvrC [Porcincola intestinalis]|uniref:excinuclease ABC subunit UvrC n=1 Tax=Porcincola intestinalis TaxID=2606632 RepID=UPI0023F40366|nr:excinuclease ABC subunit UvrC [Porcincola intestinalis]MCI6698646.1 excinuclease ABC subunit UvrC [Lachnospiraceae bacterium]MCI6767937.1 excinuclease ABC subunit UvrC [Lachnospiraceae bacterium]MDD7061090.1 excinuclease ABC subunit UvrC [Porcincola intestinalis]MDY5283442.1 excinuclease ABC subunit UvrC [Porcincola intestinalis]MDY5580363.1 excinuclease ABC subunit UvrC [Porcincola intestinalis]